MAFQVTDLTKDKKCYEKEFIDFEFDGKHISEFQLVAVSDGDRYSFNHSPEFEDETSSVKGAEGQYYWGTQINTQSRTFSLATDGMTEQDLNAFKNHFRPGKYGKFIEDHLAHRYGYCRVSEVSNFQLLPFRVEQEFLGQKININLYKGSATITFQFDDPYLYSDVNYVNTTNRLIDSDVQIPHEVTGNDTIAAFEDDTSMLKTIYLNGIPTEKSWNIQDLQNKCYIGGGYATYQNKIINGEEARFIRKESDSENNVLIYYNPSNTSSSAKITMQIPHVFSNIIWNRDGATSFNNIEGATWDGKAPLYYASILDDINNRYVYQERIDAAKAKGINFVPPKTSVIQMSKQFPKEWLPILPQQLAFILGGRMSEVEDDLSRLFEFTTPHFFYSINLAIQLAWGLYDKYDAKGRPTTLIELEDEMLNNIKNKKVLAWIVSLLAWFKTLAIYDKAGGQLQGTVKVSQLPAILAGGITYAAAEPVNVNLSLHWAALFNLMMTYMIASKAEMDGTTSRINKLNDYLTKAPVRFLTLTLHIDGINNDTYVDYNHQSVIVDNTTNFKLFPTAKRVLEEKCGDAVQSHYLKLGGNNTFNSQTGEIETVYCFQFYRGKDLEADYFDDGALKELLPMNYATLEYNYMYV